MRTNANCEIWQYTTISNFPCSIHYMHIHIHTQNIYINKSAFECFTISTALSIWHSSHSRYKRPRVHQSKQSNVYSFFANYFYMRLVCTSNFQNDNKTIPMILFYSGFVRCGANVCVRLRNTQWNHIWTLNRSYRKCLSFFNFRGRSNWYESVFGGSKTKRL